MVIQVSNVHLCYFLSISFNRGHLLSIEYPCAAYHNAKISRRGTRSCWIACLVRLLVHGAYLTPLVSAKKALLFMNTYELAALGTGPPFLFVSNELSYAELLDVHEIVNHTHTILGSIALIQVIQPVARKPVAAEAVPDFTLLYFVTVLDQTHNTGFWFDAVVASATGACLLISCICATEATVHSTGGNQRRSYRICLC